MTIFEQVPTSISNPNIEQIREEILTEVWASGKYYFDPKQVKEKNSSDIREGDESSLYFGQKESQEQYLLAWLQHFSGKIPLNWTTNEEYPTSKIIADVMQEAFNQDVQLPDELVSAAISFPNLSCNYSTGIFQRLNSEQLLFLLQRGLSEDEIKNVIKRQKNFYGENNAVDQIIQIAAKLQLNQQLLELKKISQ